MNDATGSLHSLHLNDIRRCAMNREIRQNSQRHLLIDRRPLPLAKVQTELLRRTKQQEKLSATALESIKDHSRSIAELRPARRKIKWNQKLSDWDRQQQQQQQQQQPSARLSGLELNDLHLTGSRPATSPRSLERQESQDSVSTDDCREDPASHLDVLERNIRRCFRTIKRVQKETTAREKEADQLRADNIAMRKQLLSSVAREQPPRTMRQLTLEVEALRQDLAELDEDVRILSERQEKVQQLLVQLPDDQSKENHSLDEDSSILTDDAPRPSVAAAAF